MSEDSINPTIKKILESDIFEYLDLGSIPEDDKAQMMENLILSLRSRMMLKIADILEAKDASSFDEFKNMLSDENVTDKDVSEFLDKHDINLDVITAEEAILLKAEIMGMKPKV